MGIKEEAIVRAIKMLEAAGAKYHIACGVLEFGDPLFPKEVSKKRPKVNKGIVGYVTPYVEKLTVGDIAVVPKSVYTIDVVQSVVASCCCKVHGRVPVSLPE